MFKGSGLGFRVEDFGFRLYPGVLVNGDVVGVELQGGRLVDEEHEHVDQEGEGAVLPAVQGPGLWFMVYGLWFMVDSLWFMVYRLWSMVYGLWCMVNGEGVIV